MKEIRAVQASLGRSELKIYSGFLRTSGHTCGRVRPLPASLRLVTLDQEFGLIDHSLTRTVTLKDSLGLRTSLMGAGWKLIPS